MSCALLTGVQTFALPISFKVADALSLSGGTLGGPLTGPSSATESVAGLAKFATTAEAQAMTARDVALSPGGLADGFGGSAKSVSQTSWYQNLPGGVLIQGGQQNGPTTVAKGQETHKRPVARRGGNKCKGTCIVGVVP